MRKTLKTSLLFLCLLFYQNKILSQQSSRPNVLFIAVDDLNDWIGPLDGYKINSHSF